MIHLGDITKISGYTAPPVEVIIGGSYKIYKYTFPDGKVYIGMTKNSIQTRRDQGYSHNKPLQEALRTAGWKNVIVDILEEGLSHEIACEKERYYIHIMDADKPQYRRLTLLARIYLWPENVPDCRANAPGYLWSRSEL